MMIDGFESLYNNNSATSKFSEVFKDADEFKTKFRGSALNVATITDTTLAVIYAELYARYGDSYFKATNDTRNELKTFSILYNEGLVYQKRKSIQEQILALTEAELKDDGILISNYAENPASEATEGILVGEYTGEDFAKYVNNQSVNKTKKGKLTAYRDQLFSLQDVTTKFINKFASLFEVIDWSSYLPPLAIEEEGE